MMKITIDAVRALVDLLGMQDYRLFLALYELGWSLLGWLVSYRSRLDVHLHNILLFMRL